MKIWGRANSINVQKVLWAADECGIVHERTDVGGAFGGNDQKWYLDMNPNGVVPTIEDGSIRLDRFINSLCPKGQGYYQMP